MKKQFSSIFLGTLLVVVATFSGVAHGEILGGSGKANTKNSFETGSGSDCSKGIKSDSAGLSKQKARTIALESSVGSFLKNWISVGNEFSVKVESVGYCKSESHIIQVSLQDHPKSDRPAGIARIFAGLANCGFKIEVNDLYVTEGLDRVINEPIKSCRN